MENNKDKNLETKFQNKNLKTIFKSPAKNER